MYRDGNCSSMVHSYLIHTTFTSHPLSELLQLIAHCVRSDENLHRFDDFQPKGEAASPPQESPPQESPLQEPVWHGDNLDFRPKGKQPQARCPESRQIKSR